MIVFLSAYMNLVHKSFSKKAASYQLRINKAESQLSELKVKYPPVEKEREKIESLKAECDRLSNEITEAEKNLPSRKDTSELIGEFARLATESKLVSISQKIVSKEGYNRIYVEVKLNANYSSTVAYINQIESLSPSLNVEEVEIGEPNAKAGGPASPAGPSVRLLVSSLLGETSAGEMFKARETVNALLVKRDILVSRVKPETALSEKEFKLEGITYNSESPTAIINGDVFRVDSEVKGYKIKKILPDSVVLTDGVQDHFLKMSR